MIRGAAAFLGLMWRTSVRLVLKVLDSLIGAIAVLFSTDGLPWLAALALGLAAVFGWLETPLQGIVRGFSMPLAGALPLGDVPEARPRLLSFATVVLLAAALVLWRPTRRFQLHVGAALIVLVTWFPAVLLARRLPLIERLVEQGVEREAMRVFSARNNAYAGTMTVLDLAGTGSLWDRASTLVTLIGFGWWFALVGACLVVTAALVAGRRIGAVAVIVWAFALVAVPAALLASPVMGEWERLRGDERYAAGDYGAALRRFEEARRRSPELHENRAFVERLGATKYWLGDRSSIETRFFLSETTGWTRAAHGGGSPAGTSETPERDRLEALLVMLADLAGPQIQEQDEGEEASILESSTFGRDLRGGAKDRRLAVDSVLERLQSLAERDAVKQEPFKQAVQHLEAVAVADPGWRLARRRLAELHVAWGLLEFEASRGGAIPRWRHALLLDDSLLVVHYYLARAYFRLDDRDQSRAIDEARALIAGLQHRGFLSDAYSLLGDSYQKARDDAKARLAYRRAMQLMPLVTNVNLPAQRGLLGL